MITEIDSSQFNLDYTDGRNEVISQNVFRHTCLYAAASPHPTTSNSLQIISYCLSEWQSEWNMKINSRHRRFTFAELRKQNITSRQLYLWLAPMDLIERYQFFLNNPTTLNEMETHAYYNCSWPWFGPRCEYTFDQYESDNLSFTDIIHNFYATTNTFATLACYEHLQCDRDGILLCLDWSEICDGNIDCFNEGRDEEYCWQLEINVCQNNEFRCLNGQCIDSTLYHDDQDNPDCSDGTDEVLERFKDELCINNEPTLFCEDITCVIQRDVDGMMLGDSCGQKRRDLREKAIFSIQEKSILNDTCWSALICLANPVSSFGNISCGRLCSKYDCQQLAEENCPPLIYLPSVPVLFNHVYFVYTNNGTISPFGAMPPMYVCYTQQLCPELPTTIILSSLNNATCRLFSEIPSFHGLFNPPFRFYGYVERLHHLFQACRSIINNYNSPALCKASNMYQYRNTTKCISIYRINNGIRDCFYGDDEQQIMTIEKLESLKLSKNWYKCKTLNMSISSHLIANSMCYCATNCDDQINDNDRYIQTHISFQTICDGFVELEPKMIDSKEETDETKCEQWQCNNIYTHCDGIWNCNNGADELNCNQSPLLDFKPNEHVCISSSTYQFMCLPINKAYDNIVDCLGGTDEPHLCQRHKLNTPFPQPEMFFCTGGPLNCTGVDFLCTAGVCDNGDDIKFCTINNITTQEFSFCYGKNPLLRSDIENYICDSFIFTKKKTVHFSLDKLNSKPTKQLNKIQIKTGSIHSRSKLSEKNLLQQQHYCHRG